MSDVRRDLMIRELVNAASALQGAYQQARLLNDDELANALRQTATTIGILISAARRTAALETRTS